MTITISADFESGNIKVLDASGPRSIRLEIEPDGKAHFYQWFYFRVEGEPGRRSMRIEKLGGSSYPAGWEGYDICASYDERTWFRVPCRYEDGALLIEHEVTATKIDYAYFAPYTAKKALQFTEEMAKNGAARKTLGRSLDGRSIDVLTFGEPGEGKPNLWLIARQHPGESMGSWFAEGFCEALLDEGNSMAQQLLAGAAVHVVPIMNPDGTARGHLRTNAAGTDLNRAWAEPSMDTSPEVFLVLKRMKEVGCDLFMDAHGDEAIPNNFIDGTDGIPSWSPRLAELLSTFRNQLKEATPDFQDKDGYPVSPAGSANMRIANNGVAEHFDCLAMTLEMPFKDAATNPLPKEGWSPRRCKDLARHTVAVMARMRDRLRPSA